ncbi:MAG: histidine kinase [Caulobacter sp.]|nr:histidine kinase [Caulobacter sp.]
MSNLRSLSIAHREPAAWALPPEPVQAAVQTLENARLKAQLLGDLNHDLRTPLNGIIGLTLALGATPLTPTQRDMLELIRVSGQTLDRLLEDLLLAARDRSLNDIHDVPRSARPDDAVRPAFRPRILVVDDQALNRAAMEMMLEPLDADIVQAEDGERAVSLYAENDFDLVLMDVEMPVLDGLAAVRAIRYLEREEDRERTPIFMVTAKSGPDSERASLAAGASLHITKPVTPQRLLAAARIAIPDAQA